MRALIFAMLAFKQVDSVQSLKNQPAIFQSHIISFYEINHYLTVANFLVRSIAAKPKLGPVDTAKRNYRELIKQIVKLLNQKYFQLEQYKGSYSCMSELASINELQGTIMQHFIPKMSQDLKEEENRLRLVKHFYKDVESNCNEDGEITGRFNEPLNQEGVHAITDELWQLIFSELNVNGIQNVIDTYSKLEKIFPNCKIRDEDKPKTHFSLPQKMLQAKQ